MFGGYFRELIPAVYSGNLEVFNRYDMIFLGKENLEFLKKFWENRVKKYNELARTAKSYDDRNYYSDVAADARRMTAELRDFIKLADSKPRLFEKPTFHTGSRVAYFLKNPDRYNSGAIIRVNLDEEDNSGTFVIRSYDSINFTNYDFVYVPDGVSLFLAEDYEYFRANPDFFRIYLNYLFGRVTPSEAALIDRMINALPPPSPLRA